MGDLGFWRGDFVAFLAGLTSSYSLSSLDSSTCFLATGLTCLAGTTFLAGFYYSELSSLDYWTFFFGTTAFWAGDLALTGFLTTSSSSLSSEDEGCLAFLDAPFSVLTAFTGFVWTFWVS